MNNKENASFIKEIKPLIIVLVLGGAILTGLLVAQAKAARELKLHSFRLKMEWFGGGFVSDLQSDAEVWKEKFVEGSNCINDPEIVRNVEIWEAEGIKGWANLTDEECKDLMDNVARRTRGTDSQVYKDCYALMYGGYDIFGIGVEEKVDGVKNDMTRFMKAVTTINRSGFSVGVNWYSHLLELQKQRT